ncbi:hypothetical protein F2Q68_00011762 [Brassica cretica]|uniref:Uncharacterized protein n=1 Tax=Brassica cretica TaxID=69181 RepID=A0A3N6S312_BRACR|nr:hypothetical protein F2Q68_00011762 [Brassica cretica]
MLFFQTYNLDQGYDHLCEPSDTQQWCWDDISKHEAPSTNQPSHDPHEIEKHRLTLNLRTEPSSTSNVEDTPTWESREHLRGNGKEETSINEQVMQNKHQKRRGQRWKNQSNRRRRPRNRS